MFRRLTPPRNSLGRRGITFRLLCLCRAANNRKIDEFIALYGSLACACFDARDRPQKPFSFNFSYSPVLIYRSRSPTVGSRNLSLRVSIRSLSLDFITLESLILEIRKLNLRNSNVILRYVEYLSRCFD